MFKHTLGVISTSGYLFSKRWPALTKCKFNVEQISCCLEITQSSNLIWDGSETLGLAFMDFTAFQNMAAFEDMEAIRFK